MSFETYSNGPGLKRLREVVEQISYKKIWPNNAISTTATTISTTSPAP